MEERFVIAPVAHIKNAYKEKFGVPRQSGLVPSVKSVIVFSEEYRDENVVRGIDQYSHLWLLWGFSENGENWSPTVRPPRLGGNKRVGVFATRSPFRPNHLGLSCVKLESVEKTAEGNVLVVSGADLVDNTPIYDIKPYLPYVDCVPDALGGFSEDHKNDVVDVYFNDDVKNVLTESQIKELSELLSLDPRPSYQNDVERVYAFSYDDFEVEFSFDGKRIVVSGIRKG
ncbi:MAG: tRNA (N6-threonylcarbamoyladenosine(37)-N6)-methyltransferase TrmO [Clostridia bacterium]|nr:tRNA (N6-threonylcarbamoyladenosine(37)-N6)-methyltransferase TrmO [Clostridia bacterium]